MSRFTVPPLKEPVRQSTAEQLSLRYLQHEPPLTPERCDQLGNNVLFMDQLGIAKAPLNTGEFGSFDGVGHSRF